MRAAGNWLRRWALIAAGWLLVLLGIAALVLPGPGLLMLVAGIAVLSQEYEWAERRLEPIKKRAFEAAAIGVKTWPRISVSALGGMCLIGIGFVWGIGPTIPTWWILGPTLPAQGWGTATSLVLSGLIALALLVYSVRRFGDVAPSDAAAEAEVDRHDADAEADPHEAEPH
ncbi:MAG: PGPGW domain-containing protein [Nocardioidaceae bacterium]